MADLNLDDLALFVRVVERGGFAGAARELGTPTSTVSRAIGRLESRAGVRLLHRTTRHVRPTSEGRELYATVAPAVSTLRAAAQTLEPAARQPRGRLRVTAPTDLCANFLVRAMVIAGAGIGILPHINCAADEASGRLVRVLPDYHARGASLYLVYPSTKNVPARVTAFRDFVAAAFASSATDRDGRRLRSG